MRSIIIPLALVLSIVSCRTDPSPQAMPVASVVPSSSAAVSVSVQPVSSPLTHRELSGTIGGKFDIDMSIDSDGAELRGTYSYVKNGTLLNLTGTINKEGIAELIERDTKGKQTGTFRGSLAESRFQGTWSSPGGKSLPFSLETLPGTPTVAERAKITVKLETFARERFGTPAERGRIQYPVVEAANTEASRLINAAITRSRKEQSENTGWLESMNFRINHNRHGVLDLTFEISGSGAYPSIYFEHHAFELSTGKELKAKDLFEAGSTAKLAKKLDVQLQREAKSVKSGAFKDIPEECRESQVEVHFSTTHLEEFTIGSRGVTFHYPYDFPHVALACEPPGKFAMSFEELKPYIGADSPLGRMISSGSK